MTGRRTFWDDVPGLAALARDQDGVASRDQLALLGVGPDHVAEQVRARRWRILGHAVVVLHRGPLSEGARQWMAVLHVHPRESALAGLTSLAADGLRGWGRPEVHVLVPRGCTPLRWPGVVVHETRRPFVRVQPAACQPPRLTAARAAVDAGAWERWPRSTAGVLLAVVQQRLALPDEMLEVLEEAGRLRRKRLMRATLVDAAGGADALSEIDMIPVLAAAGLPAPRRQARRRGADGRWRYLDLEVDLPDGTVLAIEVDGALHLEASTYWADMARQNALIMAGVRMLRFPAYLIRTDPAAIIEQLVAARCAAQAA